MLVEFTGLLRFVTNLCREESCNIYRLHKYQLPVLILICKTYKTNRSYKMGNHFSSESVKLKSLQHKTVLRKMGPRI